MKRICAEMVINNQEDAPYEYIEDNISSLLSREIKKILKLNIWKVHARKSIDQK